MMETNNPLDTLIKIVHGDKDYHLNGKTADLMWADECTYLDDTILNKTLNNNDKTMNLLEEKRIEDFKNSKAIDNVVKTLDEAEEIQYNLSNLLVKLSNIINELGGSANLIEHYLNNRDIRGVEAKMEELKAMIETLDDTEFAEPIGKLRNLFGLETKSKGVDKKEINKTLGFKS